MSIQTHNPPIVYLASVMAAAAASLFPLVIYLGANQEANIWSWNGLIILGQTTTPAVWLVATYKRTFGAHNPFRELSLKQILIPESTIGRGPRWMPLAVLLISRFHAHALWLGISLANAAAAVVLVSSTWPIMTVLFLAMFLPTGAFSAKLSNRQFGWLITVALVGAILVGLSHHDFTLADASVLGIMSALMLGIVRASGSGVSVPGSMLHSRRLIRQLQQATPNIVLWFSLFILILSQLIGGIVSVVIALIAGDAVFSADMLLPLCGGAIVGLASIGTLSSNSRANHSSINFILLFDTVLAQIWLFFAGAGFGFVPLFVAGGLLILYATLRSQMLLQTMKQ